MPMKMRPFFRPLLYACCRAVALLLSWALPGVAVTAAVSGGAALCVGRGAAMAVGVAVWSAALALVQASWSACHQSPIAGGRPTRPSISGTQAQLDLRPENAHDLQGRGTS